MQEIESEIERIVGLDHDAFTRSVVLPQGEFDRFLKGKPEERRKILVSLLNLRVYEDMQRIANARAAKAASQAEFIARQLASDFADATPQRLAEQRKALKEVQAEHKHAEAAREKVDDGLVIARVIRTARRDLAAVDADLTTVHQRVADAVRAEQDAVRQQAEVEKKLAALGKEAQAIGFDASRLLTLLEIIPQGEESRRGGGACRRARREGAVDREVGRRHQRGGHCPAEGRAGARAAPYEGDAGIGRSEAAPGGPAAAPCRRGAAQGAQAR